YFRALLRGMLFSQVSHGEKPKESVDELFERLAREGQVDVHGYYLHRALVSGSAEADLDRALEGWGGPTLIAQVPGRPPLSPAHRGLGAAIAAGGGGGKPLEIAEERGWHFIATPPWVCAPLVDGTLEWLRAVA